MITETLALLVSPDGELIGEPVPVPSRASVDWLNGKNPAGEVAGSLLPVDGKLVTGRPRVASDSGSVVLTHRRHEGLEDRFRIDMFSRSGDTLYTRVESAVFLDVEFITPDGRYVFFAVGDQPSASWRVLDVSTRSITTVPFEGDGFFSLDGRSAVFASYRSASEDESIPETISVSYYTLDSPGTPRLV